MSRIKSREENSLWGESESIVLASVSRDRWYFSHRTQRFEHNRRVRDRRRPHLLTATEQAREMLLPLPMDDYPTQLMQELADYRRHPITDVDPELIDGV